MTRRVSAGLHQPDLFGEWDAQQDYQRRCEARRAERERDCCTGQAPVLGRLPSGHEYAQQRCGRCGELDGIGSLMVNHEIGWLGCPRDRAAMAAEGLSGTFPRALTSREMFDRHDRVHHADCACGHPWGLHTGHLLPEESRCGLHCGCQGYRQWAARASTGDQR